MISCVDEHQQNYLHKVSEMQDEPHDCVEKHDPLRVNPTDCNHCVVCKLEEPWRKEEKKKDQRASNARTQTHLPICSHKIFQLCAHPVPMNRDRNIFKICPFQDLTCFEIAHSIYFDGLWSITKKAGSIVKPKKPNGDVEDKENKNDNSMQVKYPSYSIKLIHPV